jgi:hypothetical protein
MDTGDGQRLTAIEAVQCRGHQVPDGSEQDAESSGSKVESEFLGAP